MGSSKFCLVTDLEWLSRFLTMYQLAPPAIIGTFIALQDAIERLSRNAKQLGGGLLFTPCADDCSLSLFDADRGGFLLSIV